MVSVSLRRGPTLHKHVSTFSHSNDTLRCTPRDPNANSPHPPPTRCRPSATTRWSSPPLLRPARQQKFLHETINKGKYKYLNLLSPGNRTVQTSNERYTWGSVANHYRELKTRRVFVVLLCVPFFFFFFFVGLLSTPSALKLGLRVFWRKSAAPHTRIISIFLIFRATLRVDAA